MGIWDSSNMSCDGIVIRTFIVTMVLESGTNGEDMGEYLRQFSMTSNNKEKLTQGAAYSKNRGYRGMDKVNAFNV